MFSPTLDAIPAVVPARELLRRPSPAGALVRRLRVLGVPLLLLLLAAFARTARAEEDSVEFFNSVDIPQGQEAQDVVVFFGNANVDGEAKGDIVVIFGSVNLRGAAHHDVVNIFGGVHLYEGASVGDDLVNIFGETRLEENTSIGKDAVMLFGSMHQASTAHIGGNRVAQRIWVLLVPILILVLIVRGIVSLVRGPRRYYPMRGF